MMAYRVYEESEWGWQHDVSYYADIQLAEKDYAKRLDVAAKRNDLATYDDLDLDGREPIEPISDPFRCHIFGSRVRIWSTWSTESGTESEIVQFEIVVDKIEIQEANRND